MQFYLNERNRETATALLFEGGLGGIKMVSFKTHNINFYILFLIVWVNLI